MFRPTLKKDLVDVFGFAQDFLGNLRHVGEKIVFGEQLVVVDFSACQFYARLKHRIAGVRQQYIVFGIA